MSDINETIDKTILIQPIVSLIQFSSNARLKPLLIEQLMDMVENLKDQKTSIIQKSIVPLAYKLLDDNRAEAKGKTEKLLKQLHSVLGQ